MSHNYETLVALTLCVNFDNINHNVLGYKSGGYIDMKENIQNNKIQVEDIQMRTRLALIEQLIRCRKEKKITQADISEATGIQRPNISRLESGKYNPTLDMIVRVADSMGYEIEINLKEKQD